jgi:hypothetical protein
LACTLRDQWPSGPLSGAAKHPAGARPSECIVTFWLRKVHEVSQKGSTVEEFRDSLKYIHKKHQITGIASEGSQIADEDDLEEWLHRSVDKPFQVLLVKHVQVVLDFRGTHQHFAVQENLSEKNFKIVARIHLRLPPKTKISVRLLGFDNWQIKAGHTYAVAESRKMKINVHETNLSRRQLEINGDIDYPDVCEAYRLAARLPSWTRITIKRCDDKAFWIEDKGDYTVEAAYDSSLDTRFRFDIRIDAVHEGRTFLIQNYRFAENDPVTLWQELVDKYGFVSAQLSQMMVQGSPESGAVYYQFKLPTSLGRVTLPPQVIRVFFVALNDTEPAWESAMLISPETQEKSEVWEQLNTSTLVPICPC